MTLEKNAEFGSEERGYANECNECGSHHVFYAQGHGTEGRGRECRDCGHTWTPA